MTREQTIILLEQVPVISGVNSELLKVAKDLTAEEAAPIIKAVRLMLEACDILNQIGAKETDD